MTILHSTAIADLPEPDIHTALFKFSFFAVKRGNLTDKGCRKEVYATDLKSAKLQLARDYVLSLASKIPAGDVTCHKN
ncbi:host cell division inhibitor Icd-like protein [Proteus sp. G2666]|uniref:host cell division inhibitor Icd-like protein n=1 Tax=Proteus sp. G2666 TaxID=2698879 RepID=UPI00137881AB|nr:host cell division inhibitor Icd-like protein [Proteus sp. G2666]NBM50059.1 host cell division inhibitor Icd-like protein [Proteus sp. G2666]